MIVVTGGAGFIGSALAWKLNLIGRRDIIIVDQKAENSPKWRNIGHLEFKSYLESGDFLQRLEGGEFNGRVDAMFHMGACSDTTERDLDFLRLNNTDYTRRLAEWSVAHGVYFSYASSAATYGNGELGYSDDDSLTPQLKPLNGYGQSKLDFDIWAIQKGISKQIIGFRFFNVYGPNEYHKEHMRSLVNKGFEQIRDTGRLQLFKSYKPEYPDGGQKRDFVYVKDVVDAMMWFYTKPALKGIYNLGQGRAQTWNELAGALFAAMGKPQRIEYVEMPETLRSQYQYFTEADLKKLRATGCPTQFRGVADGVADYVHHLESPNPFLR